MKESRHSIGSDEFTEKVETLYNKIIEKKSIIEDISFRKEITPILERDIIDVICTATGTAEEDIYRQQRGSITRPLVAHMLCKFAGMTQREVANILNLTEGASVSSQLRKLNKQIYLDKNLEILVNEIYTTLESMRPKRLK